MVEWLGRCPAVDKLYSLFGDIKADTNLLTRLADGVEFERKYVDGGKYEVTYSDWVLICYVNVAWNYQPSDKSENLLSYQDCQAICDWVAQRRKEHDFPYENAKDVYCVPNNPQVNGVDEANGIAKYTIGIRVINEGEMVWG